MILRGTLKIETYLPASLCSPTARIILRDKTSSRTKETKRKKEAGNSFINVLEATA